MPDLPAWAADLARQFPVAGLTLLMAWVAYRYICDQHAAHNARTAAQHDARARSMEDAHRQQIELLLRWNDDLRRERDRLNRALARRRS